MADSNRLMKNPSYTKSYSKDGVAGDVNVRWQFILFLDHRGGVRAHHVLFTACALKTPATFHDSSKSHWKVQWFIQAYEMTSPTLLSININVTPSIANVNFARTELIS